MTDRAAHILERKVRYHRTDLSASGMESRLRRERRLLNGHIDTLRDLQGQNAEVQHALDEEMSRLKSLSTQVAEIGDRAQESFWSRFRETLSFLPGLEAPSEELRSVEAMLREQYAHSLRRLREAADFADRLEAGEQDLYDEIERLGQEIIKASEDAEQAQGQVAELDVLIDELTARLSDCSPGSRDARLIEARIDRARRQSTEHEGRRRLYQSTGARLATMKRTTTGLADTLGQLRSDISTYVHHASVRLDTVANQINAIGAAADAGVVVQDLVRALDGMNAALHEATAFVIQTQQYFRAHVDTLVADLDAKAHEEQALLAQAAAYNQAMDEIREIEHRKGRTL
ncbi:MAG: hypothetical protein ACE366_11120 [Bradymonadia bacterium]